MNSLEGIFLKDIIVHFEFIKLLYLMCQFHLNCINIANLFMYSIHYSKTLLSKADICNYKIVIKQSLFPLFMLFLMYSMLILWLALLHAWVTLVSILVMNKYPGSTTVPANVIQVLSGLCQLAPQWQVIKLEQTVYHLDWIFFLQSSKSRFLWFSVS